MTTAPAPAHEQLDYTEQLPIFVYGTLRPGCGNDRLWRGRATVVNTEPAVCPGLRLVTGGAFPYALPHADSETIGDVITANPGEWAELIADLDMLEGFRADRPDDSLYVRRPVGVGLVDVDGSIMSYERVWTYVAAHVGHVSRLRPVPGNDWMEVVR